MREFNRLLIVSENDPCRGIKLMFRHSLWEALYDLKHPKKRKDAVEFFKGDLTEFASFADLHPQKIKKMYEMVDSGELELTHQKKLGINAA